MKNLVRISVILALVIALFAGVSNGQAALVSYDSGFNVQNLENAAGTVQLTFYNRDLF